MFVLLGGILAIAGLVIFVNAGPKPQTAEESTAEAAFDPFRSVPVELPRRMASGSRGAGDMAMAGDPFASVADFQDDPVWQGARAKADEGARLLERALEAHAAGDTRAAREHGQRAQKLFTEALGDSLPLEESLRRLHGAESAPVTRIGRIRQDWNRRVMTMKKAAFL